MIRIKKLALAALVALALAGGAAQTTGDPSQWGVYKKGSFDITEAEQLAGGKDPEIPTTPGLAQQLAGGKDPELPVTSGLASHSSAAVVF
jgi:hypothetical protein